MRREAYASFRHRLLAVTERAFCPTGDGGGVDNSCASDHGGGVTSGRSFKADKSPSPSPASAEEWEKSLTPSEHDAVSVWASGVSGDDDDPIDMKAMVAAGNYEKGSIAADFVSAVEKAPKYEGTIYRGMTGVPIETFEKAGVGGTWQDAAPTSYTRDPGVTEDFAKPILVRKPDGKTAVAPGIVMRVKSKNGRSIESVADQLLDFGESEVVSVPKQKYKIVGIHKDAKFNGREVHVVDMEEAD